MVGTILIFGFLLPNLVLGSGEGNLHLLEDEVSAAMRSCMSPRSGNKDGTTQRQKRAAYQYESQYGDPSPRIDGSSQQETNQYSHERRNTSDIRDQMHVLNATDYDYEGYGGNNGGRDRLVNSMPRPAMNNRTRRGEPLVTKPESDLCLSQCIFANLQVVDTRGIPRETELWNKVQSSVSSQQSRAALRDQLRACFQELESEAEDDGCSYSNKLERCLILRFSDRKPSEPKTTKNS